jgi:hypothetical protein
MRNSFRYILMAVTASMLLSVLSSCRDSRVIDEDDMAKIYAEMLMTDQWINTTPNVKRIADTSLVYEPILRKYGYTSEDYRYSLNYYLEHNKDFAEIMNKTISILESRQAALEREKTRLEEEKKLREYVMSMSSYVDLEESLFEIQDYPSDKYGPRDTVSVVWDSLSFCFRITRIPVADTLALADTLAVTDTLKPATVPEPSGKLPTLDTLQTLPDTTKTIRKINDLRPVKVNRGFDNRELKKVKDAYLLNE